METRTSQEHETNKPSHLSASEGVREVLGEKTHEISTEKGGISTSKSKGKSKTSLRLKYEAEKKVLVQQLGDLEDIRSQLDLSQRKMCQLLMVDPSAWTRWVKNPEKVPPHVYRSLQWYLSLIDKSPSWNPHNSFGPQTQKPTAATDPEVYHRQKQLESEVEYLKAQNREAKMRVNQLQEVISEERQGISQRIENKDTSLAVWKLFVLLNFLVLFFGFLWLAVF